jgi:hypothetical protein
MNRELAEHISLLAAPIYAVMIEANMTGKGKISPQLQPELRRQAIAQAHALWLETLDTEAPA